jgi:secreted trypsin-like serine protease
MTRRRIDFERLERRLLLSVTLAGERSIAESAVLPQTEVGQSALVDVRKLIVAGDPAGTPTDSPASRVDPNTETSPYAGVGSLEIHSGSSIYLCTASVIGGSHVLTAGHCLDLNDDGEIDVGPGDVTFRLNMESTQRIPAAALHVHPDFSGFARPVVNDDVAVIELQSPVPDGVPIYALNTDPDASGQQITMIGYGTTGDAVSGYIDGSASFDVKREGANRTDDFEFDDEGGGQVEVFLADFDGPAGSPNYLGGTTLGNDLESTLGGGDSGGPAFVDVSGTLELYGINTFTTRFVDRYFWGIFPIYGPVAPLFGSGFGGITVAPYTGWIDSIVNPSDTPPTVEFNSPTDGGIVSESATVTVTAGDDIGVDSIEFLVNNQLAGAFELVDGTLKDGSWSYVWDTTTLVDGSYTIEARATDTVGKTSSDSVMVVVENGNPADPILLYFSIGTSATLDGLSVAPDDIVAWDGSNFSLFFDGSDVGLSDAFGTLTINAFSVVSPNQILLSFAQTGGILGFGNFDDSDIVQFTATSLGEATQGTWSYYFDGSDVGLTRSGEDIDALELLADGRLLISTTGSVRVPGISGRDEDLLVFAPGSLGSSTSGTWSLYFDGGNRGLGGRSEDVDGASVGPDQEIYLSTTGGFAVSGVSGGGNDIFVFRPASGSYDSSLYFDGSVQGLGSIGLTAIDIPAPAASAATGRVAPNREFAVDQRVVRISGDRNVMVQATIPQGISVVLDEMSHFPVRSFTPSPDAQFSGLAAAAAAREQLENGQVEEGIIGESELAESADRLFQEFAETSGDDLLDPILVPGIDHLIADLQAG